ncbi:MAG: DUF5691 domain-containing protein [Akkermansiaceae bacterium]|jgi:hypothetical protein|nr:DUF5691 domain-containing protein [Akkermansiaceae bacterium]
MTQDPLIAAALLGSARMAVMPPAPAPSLEGTWQAIPVENPSTGILHGLAILRTLHRAGMKSSADDASSDPCPPETKEAFPPAAVDLLKRLLAGEFPEVLPECLHLASMSQRIVPARVLPELLKAASKHPALREIIPALAGERGRWMARKHPEFSWILETSTVPENAWDDGLPAERIAWLRQTRGIDPSIAAAAIASQWSGEDPAMRESILRVIGESPQSCDEEWLENLALKDRRQEVRGLAAVALVQIEGSGFRQRAHERLRNHVKIERRLLKRFIIPHPPTTYDPAWAADGIKEKPPQGTGERAWWLQQIIANVPIADWPELLACKPDDLFHLPIDKDWQDPLLLGWIEAARRIPSRSMAERLIRFFNQLSPRPIAIPPSEYLMSVLFETMTVTSRFALLEEMAKDFPTPLLLDLLAACRQAPPSGKGHAILAQLDAAIPVYFRNLTRPQARALAVCIPQDGIQQRLESLAKLSELPPAAEEFATVLEFRKSLISHFTIP